MKNIINKKPFPKSMDKQFSDIYRWEIERSMETLFEREWEALTKEVYESCGSYGAKLGKGDDGLYYSYAKWPDKKLRDICALLHEQSDEFKGLMSKCIAEKFNHTPNMKPEEAFPDVTIEWLVDLLHEDTYNP